MDVTISMKFHGYFHIHENMDVIYGQNLTDKKVHAENLDMTRLGLDLLKM